MENFTTAAGDASMRGGIGGLLMHEKFPCIVCSSMINSIQELHNHQKDNHTTDELSLSIICLVHYMCLRNAKVLRSNLAYSKDPNLSLKIHENSCRNNCGVLLDPTVEKTNYRSFAKNTITQIETENLYSTLISVENLMRNNNELFVNSRIINADFNDAQFVSSLEIELRKVDEISDEAFFKCVKGICEDLKITDSLHGTAARSYGRKKRNLLKPINESSYREKRIKNRSVRSKKNSSLLMTERCTESLQRSEIRKKLPVYRLRENIVDESQRDNITRPIDRSSTSNYEAKFEDGSKFENNDSQTIDEDFSHAQLPVLEKVSNHSICEQEMDQMPVLEPQLPIHNNIIQRRKIYGKENLTMY